MDPIRKIRDEIAYWKQQKEDAEQILKAAKSILPRLEDCLEELAPLSAESVDHFELLGTIPEKVCQLLQHHGPLTIPGMIDLMVKNNSPSPRPSVDAAVRRLEKAKLVIRRKAPPGSGASWIFYARP